MHIKVSGLLPNPLFLPPPHLQPGPERMVGIIPVIARHGPLYALHGDGGVNSVHSFLELPPEVIVGHRASPLNHLELVKVQVRLGGGDGANLLWQGGGGQDRGGSLGSGGGSSCSCT